MTYYFSLLNTNIKDFWSDKTIFYGTVALMAPDESLMLFKCDFVRKRDDVNCSVFKIELETNEFNKYVHNMYNCPRIKLANITGNSSNSRSVTWTSLHNSDDFDGNVEESSLKNMWHAKAKPWNWISTKPECNIAIDFPKDFIAPYSVADVGAGILEDMRKMSMFESDNRVRIPEIKEVIFNYPATIVCWKDGSKTVVKCGKDESFDREKAVAMCFLKKMFKPSIKSHWLDVIHDAIKVAEEKEQRKAEARDAKVIKEATNKAKAEEAKKNTAELQAAIQKLETKSLEGMNSKVEGKDEFEEKYKDVPVKASKNEVSEEYVGKIFDQAVKENKKLAEQANNKGKKNKIDVDVMVDCIKEDLTIDEIAEMNSWDKAAVARIYYKITGTKPEKKSNTYSELDTLFEQGVSIDAATRRTGFSKNIVAMRYAKLQNKKNKEK